MPIDIYQSPANVFVHEFLGESNRVACHVYARAVHADGGFALGEATAPDGPAEAFIRPTMSSHCQARAALGQSRASPPPARMPASASPASHHAGRHHDRRRAPGFRPHHGRPVDVFFTGGTIFTGNGAGPIKLGALKPALRKE